MKWLFVFLGTAFGLFADIASRRWTMRLGNWNLIWALTGYLLATLAWFGVIWHYKSLARAGTVWTASQCLVAVLAGVFFFGEHLSTKETLGVFFTLLGIVLVSGF
jgi:multidrug transporter EmrE-like cation transporter